MPNAGDPYVLLTGPIYIGNIINWCLLGVLFMQAYVYYRAGYKDSSWIRGFVVSILVLDAIQTVFVTHDVWAALVLGFGDPSALINPPWTAYTFPVMCGVVAFLVQLFFAWRVWILGRNKIAHITAVVIVMFGLLQTIASLLAGIQAAFIPVQEVGRLKPQFILWLAGSFVTDFLIASAMLIILHKHKSSIASTNQLIDRLTVQVIHSGLITTVVALVGLVLYLLYSETFIPETAALFLGKLYTNVVMANLNTRRSNDQTYYSRNHISVLNNQLSVQTNELPMFRIQGGASGGSNTRVQVSEQDSQYPIQVKVAEDVLAKHV